MKKYVCDVCGYVYDEAAGDPDNGIAPGTRWEDLPDDFECPLCGRRQGQLQPSGVSCRNNQSRSGCESARAGALFIWRILRQTALAVAKRHRQ